MTSKRIRKRASAALRKGGECAPLGGSLLEALREQKRKAPQRKPARRSPGRRSPRR